MKEKDLPAGELKLFNETITDYIISLTHLYGLVHKEKVVEIFNLQNKEKIDIIIINDIIIDPYPVTMSVIFWTFNTIYWEMRTLFWTFWGS